jgi:hypothetical protein
MSGWLVFALIVLVVGGLLFWANRVTSRRTGGGSIDSDRYRGEGGGDTSRGNDGSSGFG